MWSCCRVQPHHSIENQITLRCKLSITWVHREHRSQALATCNTLELHLVEPVISFVL
uniref:Uncharacterized protein n=1 Tax=Arundo donax TaxID=35708 RepID=A0A0A9BQ59_ARUDO